MPQQAPYDYIRDYYRGVHERIATEPEVASFWLSRLAQVDGDSVLNVGCGPQFYDYMTRFARPPRSYVGIDINSNTFAFLRRSRDPRLLAARHRVRRAGTRIELKCADVFACGGELGGRFDFVLGIGVFATFEGQEFERLMTLMRQALKPGGRLLKITWHGAHRSAKATAEKLAYRYDMDREPLPAELVDGIASAGFVLESEAIFRCDPERHGWNAIQSCLFRRAGPPIGSLRQDAKVTSDASARWAAAE